MQREPIELRLGFRPATISIVNFRKQLPRRHPAGIVDNQPFELVRCLLNVASFKRLHSLLKFRFQLPANGGLPRYHYVWVDIA